MLKLRERSGPNGLFLFKLKKDESFSDDVVGYLNSRIDLIDDGEIMKEYNNRIMNTLYWGDKIIDNTIPVVLKIYGD